MSLEVHVGQKFHMDGKKFIVGGISHEYLMTGTVINFCELDDNDLIKIPTLYMDEEIFRGRIYDGRITYD